MMHKREEEEAAQPSIAQLQKELADLKRQLSEDKAHVEGLRQSNRELNALTRVTDNAIKTLDIHELVDLLLGRLVDIIEADAGTIALKRDEKMWITSSIGVGREETPGFAAPAGEDFTRIVLSTDKPLYVRDAQEDPRISSPFVREYNIRTMLGVPLRYRETAIGALYLLWFGIHEENERDIRLLEVTADRCAMAINNALLFDRVRQARDELEQKVRERTAELSDVIRDLSLEAEIRRRTERDLKKARREIDFYFDLMGRDIGERDRSARELLVRAVDKINTEDRLDKGDQRLLVEALRDIEGSVQITRNIKLLRAAIAERQNTQVVDLNAVLRGVIDRFSGIRDRDVTIRYRPDPLCEKVGCKVTATDLHREAYANVIGNAIERSTGPLTINVSLSYTSDDRERYCQVIIEDDGPGIPDGLKRHVFETGELDIAAKRIEGLGLFVARKLVESAGGTLRIEDRVPGDYTKGSRFVVMMPAKYAGV